MNNSDIKDDHKSNDGVVPVVGIGASAGGLAAFREMFANLSDDTGIAYVVVQHLPPTAKSELPSILKRYTSMPVEVIDEEKRLEPNRVYVLPSATLLTIEDDLLCPDISEPRKRQGEPINHFFYSLAENRREHAIAVVLSGTRDDGARGVVAIKERGGLTFAQSPQEAEYDAMPRNAVRTHCVDLVLPAAELAEELEQYVAKDRMPVSDKLAPGDEYFEHVYGALIARLGAVTGHDFSHYKRSTILRRIERRLRITKMGDLKEYSEYLREHPNEVRALFDELLITVTEFFRDPEAFEALNDQVIGRLFDVKREGEPIRVWVPGCASGEEVYSIGILLWEEAMRREVFPDFKLFATDLDKRAIGRARKGLYSVASGKRLSEERRERFFTPESGGYRVINELRDRVLFAVHDVLIDPPFARQDLVSCRNLLIYLDKEAQRQVFEVIHYALREEGRLFLGASEFVGGARELFSAVDKKHRIYRPRPSDRKILPLSDVMTSGRRSAEPKYVPMKRSPEGSGSSRLEREHHRMLNRQYAPPSILVNSDYEMIHVAGRARNFLRVPRGEPTNEVMDVVPPELSLELRSALIDVFERNQSTTTKNVAFEHNGDKACVRLVVQPLESARLPDTQLAQVIFETTDEGMDVEAVDTADVDESIRKVVEKLETENNRLRDELRTTIERYETTTEELKTSNEELLTINEELQSTTEELETSKEELQSTNEELTTVNDELSHKIGELDEVNSDLRNLLSSTAIGTIFLDRSMAIKRFTKPVQDYFNILETDIGRPLEHVTHRLNYDELFDDIQNVVRSLEPLERETRSRDGNCYIARIHPYQKVDGRIAGAVLTFFDITQRKKAQERVAESELLFRTVFDRASDGLFLFHLDDSGAPSTFINVNDSACRRLGHSAESLHRMTVYDIVEPGSVDLDAHLAKLTAEGEAIDEVRLRTRGGSTEHDEMNSRLFTVADEETVITISRDISSHKAQEKLLRASKEESERLAELRASFLANMSHEIRTPLTSIIGVSQLLSRKELPKRHRQMVKLIQTSGRRLQQTLDSVLDISRLEAGEMEPDYQRFDVVEQIEDDVEILRPLAEEKGIELELNVPEGGLELWTDPGFLDRIVYNLTQNAIKFTREGGVTVGLKKSDGSAELTVSDTGIGIDEEFLPHLFDKFKQESIGTGRRFEGSGLGLALVKQLLELMEGNIEVESQRGEGTTFTVMIPEKRPEK